MRTHCTSILWNEIAALLFTVVDYLAHHREDMAQEQVDVRNADSMETMVDDMSNASKRNLTLEKARVSRKDKVSFFLHLFAVQHFFCAEI